MQLIRPRFRLLTIDWRRLTAMLLALAGLLMAMLAWIGYSYTARTEPLVVAATAIPAGTRITPDMVTIVQAPLARPAALHGLSDPALLIGTYTRVQLSPNQVLRPELVQATPLDQHVYANDPLPPETLNADAFELSLTGISSVTAGDRLNILVLVDREHGLDPEFSVGQMDAAGSGPRVVRVLRDLNVLHVTEQAAYLEVTHAQSQYLWALAAAKISFVGELATTVDAPFGPLRAADANLVLLGMASAQDALPTTTTVPAPHR
jgi:hypothetical protein